MLAVGYCLTTGGRTGLVFVRNERSSTIVILNAEDQVVGSFKTCARPRGMRLHARPQALIVAAVTTTPSRSTTWRRKSWSSASATSPIPRRSTCTERARPLHLERGRSGSDRARPRDRGGEGPFRHRRGAGRRADHAGRALRFVASEAANLVHVIDVATSKVVKDILVGTRPRRFALSPDGRELWVSAELAGHRRYHRHGDAAARRKISFLPKGMRREQVTPVDLVMTRDGQDAPMSRSAGPTTWPSSTCRAAR